MSRVNWVSYLDAACGVVIALTVWIRERKLQVVEAGAGAPALGFGSRTPYEDLGSALMATFFLDPLFRRL